MIVTGIIERYAFSPEVYYQQSRLVCWVRSQSPGEVIQLEAVGTLAELATKFNVPSINSATLSTLSGKKCRISIRRGIKMFKEFLG